MMTDLLLIIDTDNIHTILRQLYDDMMPLCSQMTGVARAVAGFGALFYIAYRVWQSLARAEPIDVFPMLRPFAIGICILLFPTLVLGTLNTIWWMMRSLTRNWKISAYRRRTWRRWRGCMRSAGCTSCRR